MYVTEADICEACLLSTSGHCVMHTPQITVTINPGVTAPSITLTPFPFVPQGWQCPCCKRVMAPHVSMCQICPAPIFYTTTTSLGSLG